jgi:hypothetical protein
VGSVVTVTVALWGFGALTLFLLERVSRKPFPPVPTPLPAPEMA